MRLAAGPTRATRGPIWAPDLPLRRIIPRLRQALPDRESRQIHSLTPEDRRREAMELRTTLAGPVQKHWHSYEVARRVAVGTFNDGFLYAGNLAYMSMLAIFPFFITGAAIFAAVGEEGERAASINAILLAMPPVTHLVLNRTDPWILGLPFIYASLLIIYTLLILVLVWALRRGV